jgi:DNA-binding MarR family transcriptional regulator
MYNYLMDQDNQPSRQIGPELRQRIINAVRANQTADDLFDESVVDFLGISRTEGRCIDIVDRLGRVTAGRLAAESGLTTGAVTALVDRMERAGYLMRTRDAGDRRKVVIEATPLTRQFNDRLFGHLAIVLRPLFERFSDAQIAAIIDYMEIGSYINRQRTALLQEHLLGAGVPVERRLEEAALFDQEANKLATCIADQIRRGETPHGFADPDNDDD